MAEDVAPNSVPADGMGEIDLDGVVFYPWPDTPEFHAAVAEARARLDRAVQVECAFGNCVMDVDPVDGRVFGGMGPIGCGCESLPGWKSPYVDGKPMLGWAAKPVGRHGGRIAASRRKHAAHARWVESLNS